MPSPFDALRSEHSLLKLVQHRNKNQHRVATWWKHLEALIRCITKVMSTDLEGKLCQRTVYKLKHHIVPRAYRAFSNIITLGQFVSLGMVLLAMLARINSCIDALGIDLTKKMAITRTEPTTEGNDMGDDLGEVVIPSEDRSLSAPQSNSSRESSKGSIRKDEKEEKKRKSSLEEPTKKKKKKKSRSAIDDIFG